MSAPTSSHDLVLALRMLRTGLAVHDRAAADAAQLRDGDLTVLEILHREGPQSPTVLARRTSTHLATMTGVLTRLENDGWIERRPDSKDRRSIRIHATSTERIEGIYADVTTKLAQLFGAWPREKATAFQDAIDEICRVLDESSTPSGSRSSADDGRP